MSAPNQAGASKAQRQHRAELYPGQLEAWQVNSRIIALTCGTGWGKSWWGARKFASIVAEDPTADYLVFSPNFGMFKQNMLGDAIPLICEDLKWGAFVGGQGANGQINLHAGGHVYFRSGEAPKTAEGVHARAIWADEPGQLSDECWWVIRRRAGRYRARILLTGYPLSSTGWYAELYSRWKNGLEPDVTFVQRPSTDNPDYPVEEMEAMERAMPRHLFEQTYLGLFSRAAGAIYPELKPEPLGADDEERQKLIRGMTLYGGADAGWNASAFVVFGLTTDGHCWVLGAHKSGEKTAADFAPILRDLGMDQTMAAWGDPAAPATWAEHRAQGISIIPADMARVDTNSVVPSIIRIIALAKANRLHFDSRMPGLSTWLDEWEAYEWEPEGKERPRKVNDHLLDAFRYGYVMAVPAGSEAILPNKPIPALNLWSM